MKKNLSIFLILSLALSVAVFSRGQKEIEPAEVKVTTISYLYWDANQTPAMQAMADRFEELNPDIKVSLEVATWAEYWTKLEAAATGGVMPDVFWMHSGYVRKYVKGNMLMPIGDRVAADPELDYSNYPQGIVKLYEVEGVNYAIPKDFDTVGLIYSKKMFDTAGIPYPDDTWDWDKLLEVAKKLTNESQGVFGFAAKARDQSGYWNTIYQNNGYVINDAKTKSGFDTPETIEAVQFWYDLIHKHHVSPTVEQMADTKARVMFVSEKVAMYYMGSWRAAWLAKGEVTKEIADIAVMPKKARRATIYNGLGNSIAAATKNPEEAWKFVKFMGSKEGNIVQAKAGCAIPAFKGSQQPWIDAQPLFNVKAFAEMIDYGVPYPTSITAPKWSSYAKDMMVQILSGNVGVEDGCKQIATEMNKLLATEK